jgi:hypothetical protein
VIRFASRGNLPPASPQAYDRLGRNREEPVGAVWGHLDDYSVRLGIPALHPHHSQVRSFSHPFLFLYPSSGRARFYCSDLTRSHTPSSLDHPQPPSRSRSRPHSTLILPLHLHSNVVSPDGYRFSPLSLRLYGGSRSAGSTGRDSRALARSGTLNSRVRAHSRVSTVTYSSMTFLPSYPG